MLLFASLNNGEGEEEAPVTLGSRMLRGMGVFLLLLWGR